MSDLAGIRSGGQAIFSVHRSLYEAVTPHGTLSGGSLRGLCAGFLDEAADVLGEPALKGVGEDYRKLEGQWRAFAEASFPDQVEAFREVKGLIHRWHELMTEQGGEALDEITDIGTTLHERETALNQDSPLSPEEQTELFQGMQAHLEAIYEAEAAAHQALSQALS